MQPLQRQEGEHQEFFLAPPVPPLCPGELPALPDDKQSRPLFSFILGLLLYRNTGTMWQGLADALGFRIVINTGFSIAGWHWRSTHMILS